MFIKDATLNLVIAAKLKQANKICGNDLQKYAKDYPGRTLAFHLTDAGEGVGFGHKNGQLVMLKDVGTPTLIVKCSTRVFRALLAGKMNSDDLFYSGFAEVEGRAVFRDKIILTAAFGALMQQGGW